MLYSGIFEHCIGHRYFSNTCASALGAALRCFSTGCILKRPSAYPTATRLPIQEFVLPGGRNSFSPLFQRRRLCIVKDSYFGCLAARGMLNPPPVLQCLSFTSATLGAWAQSCWCLTVTSSHVLRRNEMAVHGR